MSRSQDYNETKTPSLVYDYSLIHVHTILFLKPNDVGMSIAWMQHNINNVIRVRYVSKPLYATMNFSFKMICYSNTNIFTGDQFK